MARTWAWRKGWGYPASGSMNIFKGGKIVDAQATWQNDALRET